MTDVWSERAEAYRQSEAHREGEDLDLIVAWVRAPRSMSPRAAATWPDAYAMPGSMS